MLGKAILALALIVGLAGCDIYTNQPLAFKPSTTTKYCVDNVTYLFFGSKQGSKGYGGVTVQLDSNGKVKLCNIESSSSGDSRF